MGKNGHPGPIEYATLGIVSQNIFQIDKTCLLGKEWNRKTVTITRQRTRCPTIGSNFKTLNPPNISIIITAVILLPRQGTLKSAELDVCEEGFLTKLRLLEGR